MALAGALAWHYRPAPAEAVAAQAPAPLQAAPGALSEQSFEELLAWRSDGQWRLVRLRGQPAVLVLEFPNLLAQGRALNRAAALIEKGDGSRDHVPDDAALADLIAKGGDNAATYFFGHDYTATGLARFFNLALAQQVALNADEQRLRAALLAAGLLAQGQGGLVSGVEPGALVTFSAVQPDDRSTPQDEGVDPARRASVLRHELSHGRYFTDAAYRAHCAFFWRQLMSEGERQAWRAYLGAQGYDVRNEELMINEMQAFLMHTPDERDFKAADLHWKPADLAALRDRFQLGLKP